MSEEERINDLIVQYKSLSYQSQLDFKDFVNSYTKDPDKKLRYLKWKESNSLSLKKLFDNLMNEGLIHKYGKRSLGEIRMNEQFMEVIYLFFQIHFSGEEMLPDDNGYFYEQLMTPERLNYRFTGLNDHAVPILWTGTVRQLLDFICIMEKEGFIDPIKELHGNVIRQCFKIAEDQLKESPTEADTLRAWYGVAKKSLSKIKHYGAMETRQEKRLSPILRALEVSY